MRELAAICIALACLAGCQTGATLGATCSRASECASGTCEFGRCRTACVANRDCPAGASCLRDASGIGACNLDVDLGCENGIGRRCPSGLACVADRCEQVCASESECPSDGECRAVSSGDVRFCFDLRASVDASVLDAADAGPGQNVDAAASCGIVSACFERAGAACALDCQGHVWCWGQQHAGRLGNGSTDDAVVVTPALVMDDAHAVLQAVDTLACGDGFACAHVAPETAEHAGHVLCWGYDAAEAWDHTTAHGTATDLYTPIVAGSVQIAASGSHACVLDRTTSALLCFGRNDGLIDPAMPLAAFVPVPTAPSVGITDAVAIGVAAYGACALVTGGQIRCWGDNDYGQAGRAPIDTVLGEEPLVGLTTVQSSMGTALQGATQLAVGLTQRAVLAPAGADGALALHTWGGNDFAQLGERADWAGGPCDDFLHVDDVCRSVPLTPAGAPLFESIASDGAALASCGVVASNHHVLCWGLNLGSHAGRLNGGDVWLATHQEVLREADPAMPLTDVVNVFVGASNACATRSDGTLWCWGPNQDAQLARPIDSASYLAVQIPISVL